MEFSRQEYWSGLPFSSPGDLPKPGITPGSPALQADSVSSEPPGKPYLVTGIIYLQAVLTKWSLNIVNFHAFFSNNLRIIKSFFFSLTSSSLYYIHAQLLSHVQLFVTPWTIAHQALLSLEFLRQEYWRQLPFPVASSWPRDQTCVSGGSCTGRRILYNWATWCLLILLNLPNYCSLNSLLLFTVNAYLDVLTSLLTPNFLYSAPSSESTSLFPEVCLLGLAILLSVHKWQSLLVALCLQMTLFLLKFTRLFAKNIDFCIFIFPSVLQMYYSIVLAAIVLLRNFLSAKLYLFHW